MTDLINTSLQTINKLLILLIMCHSINGCPLLRVCVHIVCFHCVCVHFGGVNCKAQITSMGHHTWPYVMSLNTCILFYWLSLLLITMDAPSFGSFQQRLWLNSPIWGWQSLAQFAHTSIDSVCCFVSPDFPFHSVKYYKFQWFLQVWIVQIACCIFDSV